MAKIADGLLETARNELVKAWGDDNGMVEHCLNRIAAIVPLEKGGYYAIEKPRIETEICYGYGQDGITNCNEEDMAYAKCKAIAKKRNFIAYNMGEYLDKWSLDSHDEYVHRQMYPYKDGVQLRDVLERECWERHYSHFPSLPVTENDRRNINAAVRRLAEEFRKRLEAYWKRYGDSKIIAHAYLRD